MEWPYTVTHRACHYQGILVANHYLWLRTCSLLVLLLVVEPLGNKAFAQKINPSGRDLELHTSLRHGSSIVGSVLLKISTEDELSFSAPGVSELLAPLIVPETMDKILDRSKDERLSPADFTAEGVQMRFDSASFELVLEIPENLQRDRVLSLESKQDERRFRKPAKASGYLNWRFAATQRSARQPNSSDHTLSQNHSVEAAFRLFDTVLESEFRYERPDTDQSGEFYRHSSRIVHDLPDSSTRLVAGDIFTFGSHFQDSADLLGIGISRDFDLIPTRNVRPSAARRFTLQSPSEVDVYVDGLLLRKLSLPAGVFSLQDIPLATGSNDIELRIEDDTGRVERISFNVATAQDLLPSGEFDYSLAAGISSDPGIGGPDYDADNKVVTANMRFGIAPWLTLGLNAQRSELVKQLGANALVATDIGRFNINLSASDIRTRGRGGALSVGYDADFGRKNPKGRRLTVQLEALSPQFGGVNADELGNNSGPLNTSVVLANASYSQYLSERLRGSIGLGYSRHRAPFDELYSLRTALSGSFKESPGSWNLSVALQDSRLDGSDVVALLSFSWPLGEHGKLRLNSTAPDYAQEVAYNYSRDQGRTGGIRSDLSIESNPDNDAELSGGIEYSANRFIAALDHDSNFTHLNGRDRTHVTRARFETSIAMADGKVAIGRPVSNSFAIMHRHPSLDGKEVRVDPAENSDLVRSDSLGNVLIPDLGSYHSRVVNYDVDDLPLGYDLGEGAFAVKPPYQAGYSLQVGSDATVTMIGTLIDQASGVPLSLVAGEAHYQNDPDVEPIVFFSNRTGRFAISGMKPGDYLLKLNTQPGREHRVVIEKGTNALLRVGELKVR